MYFRSYIHYSLLNHFRPILKIQVANCKNEKPKKSPKEPPTATKTPRSSKIKYSSKVVMWLESKYKFKMAWLALGKGKLLLWVSYEILLHSGKHFESLSAGWVRSKVIIHSYSAWSVHGDKFKSANSKMSQNWGMVQILVHPVLFCTNFGIKTFSM